jgi:hypothetical protein
VRDPFAGWLELPYSLHPYQYGYSNPVRWTDPSGECVGWIWGDPTCQFIGWERVGRGDLEWEEGRPWGGAAVDFTPGVGDVKGLIEVFTGCDIATGEDLGAWRWAGLLGAGELRHLRHLKALPLPQSGRSINGIPAQDYPRSLPGNAGRNARRIAGEDALEALYGPGRARIPFQTQWGRREVDLVVEQNGRIYAYESKNYKKPVPAGTHALQEALKDHELMHTIPGYTPVWHFWDAGPTPRLAATLEEFGIQYIVYQP